MTDVSDLAARLEVLERTVDNLRMPDSSDAALIHLTRRLEALRSSGTAELLTESCAAEMMLHFAMLLMRFEAAGKQVQEGLRSAEALAARVASLEAARFPVVSGRAQSAESLDGRISHVVPDRSQMTSLSGNARCWLENMPDGRPPSSLKRSGSRCETYALSRVARHHTNGAQDPVLASPCGVGSGRCTDRHCDFSTLLRR